MSIRALGLIALMMLSLPILGCSTYMKSAHLPDPDIIESRAEYRSLWDEAIAKQGIHKGMEIADVYFSWGRPVHRVRTGERERWIYLFEDESQPTHVVWLFFQDGRLRKWSVDRGNMEFINPSKIDLPPSERHDPDSELVK